jgi:hypothetical protein
MLFLCQSDSPPSQSLAGQPIAYAPFRSIPNLGAGAPKPAAVLAKGSPPSKSAQRKQVKRKRVTQGPVRRQRQATDGPPTPSSSSPSPVRAAVEIGAVLPILGQHTADSSRLPDGTIPVPSWTLIQDDDQPAAAATQATNTDKAQAEDEDLGGTQTAPAARTAVDQTEVS